MMRNVVRNVLKTLSRRLNVGAQSTRLEIERSRMLLGRMQGDRNRAIEHPGSLRELEYGVFSQWNEDGIVDWMVSKLFIETPLFVEFGVEDYMESNTRFLLQGKNWRGVVIERDRSAIERIRGWKLFWRYDLTALHASVTAENINALLREGAADGDIGLLSIDVDGMDYWIWKAIDAAQPRIVICEYNSVFGPDEAVTVPYDADFDRGKAHYSHLYFGASLHALRRLAAEKGYVWIGCESHGVNAFFVREDLAGAVEGLVEGARYVESRLRESRGKDGRLTYAAGAERRRLIREMPVFDLDRGEVRPLGDQPPTLR